VTREGRLAVGLPGNPLSVLAGLELFVAPALAALSGVADPAPARERRRLAAAVRRNPRRTRVLPATLEDGGVRALGAGQSHLLASAAAANALVVIPPGDGEEQAGAAVEVLPL
jgi:molybdopterin molybdotransferase